MIPTALPTFAHLHRVPDRKGFSLVEVCLAVGIVAFALLPLVGLLSVGLDSYRRSNMRSRAAQAVNQISSCLKLATADVDPSTGKPTGVYRAAAPFDKDIDPGSPAITWQMGSAAKPFIFYFSDNGEVTVTSNSNKSMVAVVVLTAPTSQFVPGVAQIVVAWPAVGTPSYNGANGISFVNPQGHEESTISFIPNPAPPAFSSPN